MERPLFRALEGLAPTTRLPLPLPLLLMGDRCFTCFPPCCCCVCVTLIMERKRVNAAGAVAALHAMPSSVSTAADAAVVEAYVTGEPLELLGVRGWSLPPPPPKPPKAARVSLPAPPPRPLPLPPLGPAAVTTAVAWCAASDDADEEEEEDDEGEKWDAAPCRGEEGVVCAACGSD